MKGTEFVPSTSVQYFEPVCSESTASAVAAIIRKTTPRSNRCRDVRRIPRPMPRHAMEALEAATVGGARLRGGLDDFGVVAPGRRADLRVLYFDPREDLACLAGIEWVTARGRLPVHEVDRQRAQARTGPQR